MVIRFTDFIDIDDGNHQEVIDFVNKYFIAEMPRFAGEEDQNIFQEDNDRLFNNAYKQKAIELVRMYNVHHCAVALNGCKKESTDRCNRGYDRTDAIPETSIDLDKRIPIVYRRRNVNTDLNIVPYNLEILMDWGSHLNLEYCGGSPLSALYLYNYCFKGASRRERIEITSEQEDDSQDEIKLFIYGRVMCSMAAVWRLYGYQDYPASHPAVTVFKVRTGAQLNDFSQHGQVTDLMVYYSRPLELHRLKFTEFFEMYNSDCHLPKYYQDRPNEENMSYFKVSIDLAATIVTRFIYKPVKQCPRCVRMEMLYPMHGDIFWLRLILLKRPVLNDQDALTFHPLRGGGEPTTYLSYQQSALAHGYITSVQDANQTFNDMRTNASPSLCRRYFVVLTLQGYTTHPIYDNDDNRNHMMRDYILDDNPREVAEQMMLRDLQRLFHKSNSSLEKYGFPKPDGVPTELEKQQSKWINQQTQEEQRLLLQQLNTSQPNNQEQQQAFDTIMESVLRFKHADRDSLSNHEFHFISGPGGTGKTALFKKLHAACHAEGILIGVCAATTLAALLFDHGTTAHKLFSYPVEDDEVVDDIHPTECNFSEQRSEWLHEVLVIFWDEIVSNDRSLFEAVLRAMETTWDKPRYYVFVCAGDFAQVQ
jgi:hypothetical protein